MESVLTDRDELVAKLQAERQCRKIFSTEKYRRVCIIGARKGVIALFELHRQKGQ